MAARKRKSGDACAFNPEWEKAYFCVLHENNVKCLICGNILQCLKKYTLKRHYDALHKEYDALTEEDRQIRLEELKDSNDEKDSAKGEEQLVGPALKASYAVALQIAKSGKPFSDGQYIKNCMIAAAEIIEPLSVSKFEAMPLSRQTITRRIATMGEDVYRQLKEAAEKFVAFSICTDESTDINDIAQLAIFIRGVDSSLCVTEELLDVVALKDTTKGVDIYNAVCSSIESIKLSLLKIASATTDGAPAMIGKHSGLIGFLKKKITEMGGQLLASIHCIIHQESLCAKIAKIKTVSDFVVRVINMLRGSSLTHRQLQQFLIDIDADFKDIVYHSNVRWLSLGKVLIRFFALLDNIAEFCENKDIHGENLRDPLWRADLAFSADIFEHLNNLNLELQGKDVLISDLFNNVEAFKNKLEFWKSQLEAGDASHFERLHSVKNETIDLKSYAEIIGELGEEFNKRFQDFQKLKPTLDLFVKPFSVQVSHAPHDLQMELLQLQSDEFLKEKYQLAPSLQDFYKNFPQHKYPRLHRKAAQVLSMFGSTYLCEQFFSILKYIKSKHRSTISEANLCNTFRMCVSRFQPDLETILSKK